MWLWILLIVFTIVKCNGNNNSNSTRLLNVLQRQQEYQNISKLTSLEFPFDLGKQYYNFTYLMIYFSRTNYSY
jgi:hypothetical protein